MATDHKRRRISKKGEGKMATTEQVLAGIMRSKEHQKKICSNIHAQQENMAWLTSMYDKLRKEYRNKYVAVLNKKVVVTSANLGELRKALNEYPAAEVAAVSYITEKRPLLIM
jgi:hypothetical protein